MRRTTLGWRPATIVRSTMMPFFLLSLSLVASGRLLGEALGCKEVAAIAQMARANSVEAMVRLKPTAGSGDRANLVFAFRSFELRPHDRLAAAKVLSLIPGNGEQDFDWHTFGDSLCDAESVRDMKTLAGLGDRLPRDLARAVLIVPEKMLDYVSYAYASIQYPDSDYTLQMQAVCRKRKPEFLKAVDLLAVDDRKWFITKIFDPSRCRAIALPEAN